MSAKDKFHEIVKTALQKDRWIITHDPYPLQAGSFNLAIDIGAEKIIAAEQKGRKIAVEIKSFRSPYRIADFYNALGQFISYRSALKLQDKDRQLYLGVPSDIYEEFFQTSFIQELVQENQVYLLTYNIEQEVIERWLP
jgi:hypothetical protein